MTGGSADPAERCDGGCVAADGIAVDEGTDLSTLLSMGCAQTTAGDASRTAAHMRDIA